jgi:hypothetical protein
VFEPRTALDNIDRVDLKYIGGVERFDLWYRIEATTMRPHALRVHVVGGNMSEWDIFTLPVRDNREWQGKILGNWGDVQLTYEEADLIDTYIKCFVPWMLGRNLTNGA